MPWRIDQRPGGRYAVVNAQTGRVAGIHMTLVKAQRQLAALYAALKRESGGGGRAA